MPTPYLTRPATAALWDFLEGADGVRPVDRLGHVSDLATGFEPSFPQTTPAVVDTDPANEGKLTQRGREFGLDKNFTGSDLTVAGVGNWTRLLRDVTVRAVIDYKIENHNNGNVGVLCVRGLNDGTDAERELWGAELERVDANNLILRARWQGKTGAQAVLAGASFLKPAGFFEVAVTRRWDATDSVTVRYYVNGQLIGTETVTDTTRNDIGEGAGGHVVIGSRRSSNPIVGFTDHLPNDTVVDHISVDGDEISAEEIRQDYRRFFVHQPQAYARVRAYQPPGEAWNRDVDANIQRVFASEADMIGQALSDAHRLRDDFLPDRAYGAALVRWETITGLAPGPSDSIATRRTRVLGFLRKILGYQIDDLKFALEPLFGLDSADIEIHEHGPLRTDDFSVDDITTPPSKIWTTNVGNGIVGVALGVSGIGALAGSDVKWSQGVNAPHRKTPLTTRDGFEAVGAAFVTKFDSITLLASIAPLVGHLWINTEKEVLAIGIRDNGADRELGAVFESYGDTGALTVFASPQNTIPFWLLTRYLGEGNYEARFSTTGPATGYSAPFALTGPTNPRYVGYGGIHRIDAGAGGEFSVNFDDAQIYEPAGVRPLSWQAFRDPGLGGEYDLGKAQQQILKQRPAHTYACAIDDLGGFTLGPSGDGLLGCTPLFPLPPIIS